VTCKLTYFFRDVTSATDSGWTETFYVGNTDSESALSIATNPGWLRERLAFLASSYMLAAIRAQNTALRADNTRARYTSRTGVGLYPVGGRNLADGEAPWQGVLVEIAAGTNAVRRMVVRGIASDVIGNNLEYKPPPAFQQAFDAWRGDLGVQPNAYQLRKVTYGTTAPLPLSATVLADRRSMSLTYGPTLAPPVLVPKLVIKMVGIQNCSPTLGNWRVLSNDGTTVTLYPRRRILYGTPTAPLQVQPATAGYFQIDSVEPLRGGERRAGRPSDQLRGRARVRAG